MLSERTETVPTRVFQSWDEEFPVDGGKHTVLGRYHFAIDDFQQRMADTPVDVPLCSPEFFVAGRAFRLDVFPTHSTCPAFVRACLRYRGREDLHINLSICLQRSDGKFQFWHGLMFKWHAHEGSKTWYNDTFFKEALLTRADALLPGGKLVMTCQIKFEDPDFSGAVFESWGRLERQRVSGSRLVTFEDFRRRLEAADEAAENQRLLSPEFSVAGKTFQVVAYPTSVYRKDSVCVALSHFGVSDLEVGFRVFVRDDCAYCSEEYKPGTSGPEKCRKNGDFDFGIVRFTRRQTERGGNIVLKELLLSHSSTFLPNGRLSIMCYVDVYLGDRFTEGKGAPPKFPSLADDMADLFADSAFSDVKITCGERSFACHKNILSARSDVFKAMLTHEGTAESLSNEVVVDDVDPDVMDLLLRFIYGDKCDGVTEETACDLLSAADKYNVTGMRSLCEEFLASSISLDNVDRILRLGYLHGAKRLLKLVLEFVVANMEEVRGSPGWRALKESHPQVVAELFEMQNSGLRK